MRRQTQVGTERSPALRKALFQLGLVGERGDDDDFAAVFPVGRRRDLVIIGQLQRIDDAQDLVEVAPRRRRLLFDGMEERSSDQKIDRIKDREGFLKADYER